jgi:hypothetical protein
MRSILGATFLLMWGFATTASAQTADPYTNYLLGQANRVGQEALDYARREAVPAVQRQQAREQLLWNYCNAGYTQACQELTGLYNRRTARTDQLMQQYQQYYNQNWINSFGR